MKIILIMAFLLPCIGNAKIYSTSLKKEISQSEFLNLIPKDGFNIVLGEYHYNKTIQANQARMIELIIEHHNLNNSFSLGWEFLEYQFQNRLDSAFSDYETKLINWGQFITKAIPNTRNKHIEYRPIIDTVAKYQGQLIATNASRSVKKKLMENGDTVLSNQDTPHIWLKPTINYFKRFEAAMGGHADPLTLKKYFLAQHYTDAIIASKLNELSIYKFKFLVIGSFHSDFYDGVNRCLKDNNILLKFVDRNDYTDQQWLELTSSNIKYGNISDFIIY